MHVTIDSNDNDIISENVNVHIDWGVLSQTPLLNFPNDILMSVAHRLYIGSAHIGGKVSPISVVNGYTEIEINGALYRSHPCYVKKGCWYDWEYFNWEGFDTPIAARIIVILDLSECEIVHNMEHNPDTLPDDATDRVVPHLSKEKWVILVAAQSLEINPDELNDAHFDSKIYKRIKLHNDNGI